MFISYPNKDVKLAGDKLTSVGIRGGLPIEKNHLGSNQLLKYLKLWEWMRSEKRTQDTFLIQRLGSSKGICKDPEEKVERKVGEKLGGPQERTLLSNQDLDKQLNLSVPVSSIAKIKIYKINL